MAKKEKIGRKRKNRPTRKKISQKRKKSAEKKKISAKKYLENPFFRKKNKHLMKKKDIIRLSQLHIKEVISIILIKHFFGLFDNGAILTDNPII